MIVRSKKTPGIGANDSGEFLTGSFPLFSSSRVKKGVFLSGMDFPGIYAILLRRRVNSLFLWAALFLCSIPRAAAWSTFLTAAV